MEYVLKFENAYVNVDADERDREGKVYSFYFKTLQKEQHVHSSFFSLLNSLPHTWCPKDFGVTIVALY